MKAYAFELTNGQFAYLPVNEANGNEVVIAGLTHATWFDDIPANPLTSKVSYVASMLPEGILLTGDVAYCEIEGINVIVTD